ncbi:hypothetical protein [Nocardioides daphniae]|uniref:WD40 repeat domain-containing protein n=1 Tax=Nocardioides daphniae TaxID=402297 RepID=A0A4P7UAL0_9ACTN|nr:hypothetical protein [Nocardioides daphniae]QCC77110.1 hypothetical protein E2C04_07605 [Nocardioides daphniae]GGD19723.1 hypothetical protein GCM10007231_18600 [Nocardioides daphniae]
MSPRLTDLMHDRADRLSAPVVDLDAVVTAGERRVRRRRALAGAGVAAATAAVLVGALALPQLGPASNPGRTSGSQFSFAGAFSDGSPAYANGTSVHVAGREFTVPTDVHAFVQTTRGIVYADRGGDVWSATGDEATTKVGTIDRDEPRLDSDGSLAAWAQPREEGNELALLDQADGSVVSVPVTGRASEVRVVALDGADVYARDRDRVVRWDSTGDRTTPVMPWSGDVEVADVEDGFIAYRAQEAGQDVSRVTRTAGEGTTLDAWMMLDLSDDGSHVLGEIEPDVFAVFDVAAGTHQPVTVPGYEFVIGYIWADADTYLMLGLNKPWDTTPADLLSCELGGGCTVVAEAVGRAGNDLVLGFGEPMDG